MPSGGLGGHDYHMFTIDTVKFKLSFGDCEYAEARRFINSLSENSIEQLFDSIYKNVWLENVYGVQNKTYDTYLIGQSSTQEFINITATNSTFWGLVPFQLVVLANVAFYPYSCGDCRWNVELDFGSATDFNFTNYDPNSSTTNNSTKTN